jgi:purine-binding chemotaxis protein CheW
MSRDLLIARVAGQRFAVPAVEVQSVVELGLVVPVPRAPVWIAGLTTQRSRTLTVVDVSIAIDPAAPPVPHRFALVAEIDGCGYALAVDAVENVLPAEGEVQNPRIKLAPGWARIAEGMVETAVGTVLLIDLAHLVNKTEELEAA